MYLIDSVRNRNAVYSRASAKRKLSNLCDSRRDFNACQLFTALYQIVCNACNIGRKRYTFQFLTIHKHSLFHFRHAVRNLDAFQQSVAKSSFVNSDNCVRHGDKSQRRIIKRHKSNFYYRLAANGIRYMNLSALPEIPCNLYTVPGSLCLKIAFRRKSHSPLISLAPAPADKKCREECHYRYNSFPFFHFQPLL